MSFLSSLADGAGIFCAIEDFTFTYALYYADGNYCTPGPMFPRFVKLCRRKQAPVWIIKGPSDSVYDSWALLPTGSWLLWSYHTCVRILCCSLQSQTTLRNG